MLDKITYDKERERGAHERKALEKSLDALLVLRGPAFWVPILRSIRTIRTSTCSKENLKDYSDDHRPRTDPSQSSLHVLEKRKQIC